MRSRPLFLLHLVLACAVALFLPEADGRGNQEEPAGEPTETPATQVGDRQSDGLAREEMWRAPTAEDWAKPVLIPFQRTWEDAVAVSDRTGKPILICVNMDGEIASEHYAGVRYRQPEVAALYEPYVCVIASVYRHNPRDYDDQGRRIPCPRFGSVTCDEHIWIEPLLYERYFEGIRVAPRHIMVELDGSESYDVYYAFDTAGVFDQVRSGIAEREITPPPIAEGDRTLAERVGSRDERDRRAVEEAYANGDAGTRAELLEAAQANIDAAPLDLLRQAVFGLDADLAAKAREALALTNDAEATDLIAEALRVPLSADEREPLVAALERLGSESERARTLAVVQRGMGATSSEVDLDGWSGAAASYAADAAAVGLSERLRRADEALRARPDDSGALLDKAESLLERAIAPERGAVLGGGVRDKFQRLMFEDTRQMIEKARVAGADDWRLSALPALLAYYEGRIQQAYSLAAQAAPRVPAGAPGWTAISTLALLAEARQVAIREAVAQRNDWPAAWLADVNAVYGVLAQHPLGNEAHVAAHVQLLNELAAYAPAARALGQGLGRFPLSAELHRLFRAQLLRDSGPAGLEAAYEAWLQRDDAFDELPWFAGWASLVAAESHRRAREADAAVAAYERAVTHLEAYAARFPADAASADFYAAVCLAGRARLALERRELEAALELTLAGFERNPDAASARDGLNLSAVDTARALRSEFNRAQRTEDAAKIDEALSKLDPVHLRQPAFERTVRPRSGVNRRPATGR